MPLVKLKGNKINQISRFTKADLLTLYYISLPQASSGKSYAGWITSKIL